MDTGPILITGASGYLGRTLMTMAPPAQALHLVQHQAPLSAVPPGSELHPLDLADGEAVSRLFERVQPALVIHAAANMALEAMDRSIVRATAHVAAGCAATGARLLHLSTDALFDGENAPYTESDMPMPVHAYGRAKAAAEAFVRPLPSGRACIVRTSLITGVEPLDPRSAWVADSIRQHRHITLFVDELRCPIWVEDLAAALWELAAMETWLPVLHIAGPEALSRYALGLLIAAYEGLPVSGLSCGLSPDQPSPRPRDARLDTRLATRLLRRRLSPISEIFAPKSTVG